MFLDKDLSEMEFHIHTHLERLATLFESASHAFEIESGVFVVGEVASPKVDLYGLGLQGDISVQSGIEVLLNMVGFCPVNLSGTGHVCTEGKTLCPTIIEMECV